METCGECCGGEEDDLDQPFYFILNSTNLRFDYSDPKMQNRICSTSGCDANSLQARVKP